MDCQQLQASNIIVSPVGIHVMVVDDDTTSLTLVSNLLKTLNYQVALFNDPIFALYTLRAGKHSFDLIMTALYMSKMDGFELTRRVNNEIKLPVIMLSTDDRECVMLRAIEEGVALYLMKPFSPNDLRNIWQFVITAKSRRMPSPNLLVEESRSHGPVEFRAVETHSSNKVVQERKKKKKDSKSKGGNQEKEKEKMEIISPPKKKAKVTWTDFLQYRFLNAVHYIGLDRAVPKKILEVMNVPFLTRENVASHLQKYRIFLRKVAERCMLASDKTTEEIIWSKFLSRHASLVLEKIQQKRAFSLNSSQNPNNISGPQTPNPSNRGDRRRFTHGQLSFAKNLSPYGLRPTASFVYGGVGALPSNQTNVQALNEPQIHNLAPYGHSYNLGSSLINDNYNPGYSVGVGGEIPGVVSNGEDGNCVGLNAMGMGNFQRDEFGQYGHIGVGVGGDINSYNWGLMSTNNGVNFGGEFQSTIGSSIDVIPHNKVGGQEDSGFLFQLENISENPIPNQEEAINGGFMTEQSNQVQYNNDMNADEEADPFSADLQVLEEFLASLLKSDYPAEG